MNPNTNAGGHGNVASKHRKLYVRFENPGFKMRECLKVALILRWLPDSFNPLITTLEALQDEEKLTLDFV